MHDLTLLTLAGIALLGIACQWFAWWVRLPAILFLLLAGIVAGPISGWLKPDSLFGDLLFPIVSLSVAVILFEGSLTLRLSEIRGLETVVRRMVSVGMLVTWCVTTIATHLLLGFDWPLSLLFGAVMVVTGPTVIVPMLRTVRPTARIGNILRWEGIVIDPVGALLAVLVFEFIVAGQGGKALGHTLMTFASVLIVGLGLGVSAGHGLGLALRRYWLPEYLHNVATLALVFAAFAISDLLVEESGLLTVTVMGMWLANMKGVPVERILSFKESLSVMLISVLFIILAARIDFRDFVILGWGALGVFLVIQFVARPLKVLVSSAGSDLNWRERALLGWIAPRGIVAAAVASLFALRLAAEGQAQAELLVPLTFAVIIGTVVLQSATARPLANALGVSEPEPHGFLIVGANPVARAVGLALQRQGCHVLLCDPYWSNVRAARMAGLNVFYGNPVSEFADQRLDLVGLGHLLGLSPDATLNSLAVERYRHEFGDNRVYSLPTAAENSSEGGQRHLSHNSGRTAFSMDADYARLAEMLSLDAEVRETGLSEQFDFDDFHRRHDTRALPLFGVDPKGNLKIFNGEQELQPGPGWTLISLVEPSESED